MPKTTVYENRDPQFGEDYVWGYSKRIDAKGMILPET
jgi:hypothetical protein